MEVQIVESMEQLTVLEDSWKKLIRECGDLDNPYICFDWICQWWQCFGEKDRLHIIVLAESSRIIGIGPFMANRNAHGSIIRFIGYPQANYMDLLIADGVDRAACIQQIFNQITKNRQWTGLDLHGLRDDSVNYPYICEYLRANRVVHFVTEAPAFSVRPEGEAIESYIKARASKHKVFQNAKRTKKKLELLGEVKYETLDSAQIELIFEMHDKRWEQKLDTSQFTLPSSRRFFSQLVMESGSDFKAVVTALYLNRRFLAFEYGFDCNGRYYLYKMAHDNDYHCYSPGRMILEEKVRVRFNEGLKEFDFGPGFERYKTEWTDCCFSVHRVIVRGVKPLAGWYYLKCLSQEKLKAWLKQHPQVVNFKRNTLGKIRFMFTEALRSVKENLSRKGIFGLLTSEVSHFAKWCYHTEHFLVGEREIKYEKKPKPECQLRLATIEDLEELARLSGEEYQSLIRRFFRNDKCILVTERQQICQGAWLSLTKLAIEKWDYQVDLTSEQACLEGFFIKESKDPQTKLELGLLADYAVQVVKGQSCSRLLVVAQLAQEDYKQAGFELKQQISKVCKFGYETFKTQNLP